MLSTKTIFRLRFALLIPALSFLLFSCQSEEEKIYESFIDQNPKVEEWIGKELIFPDKLGADLKKELSIDKFKDQETGKLIVYLEAGCASCIESINYWMGYLGSIDLQGVKPCFVIGGIRGQVEYAAGMTQLDKTPYSIFVDEGYDFLHVNQLSEDRVYHTFLLNEKNEVVLMGSPAMASFLKDIYTSKISSL